MDETKIEMDVVIKDIDDATEKIEKYIELLKEAKTLAEELASLELKVDVI